MIYFSFPPWKNSAIFSWYFLSNWIWRLKRRVLHWINTLGNVSPISSKHTYCSKNGKKHNQINKYFHDFVEHDFLFDILIQILQQTSKSFKLDMSNFKPTQNPHTYLVRLSNKTENKMWKPNFWPGFAY